MVSTIKDTESSASQWPRGGGIGSRAYRLATHQRSLWEYISRAASSSASNFRPNAPHESPLTSLISAKVSNCPVTDEIALPSIPTIFPVARSCRNTLSPINLSHSGSDRWVGTWCCDTIYFFLNSVRSLLTVPVPKLHLEIDREDNSLLFVRVHHESVLGVVLRWWRVRDGSELGRTLWPASNEVPDRMPPPVPNRPTFAWDLPHQLRWPLPMWCPSPTALATGSWRPLSLVDQGRVPCPWSPPVRTRRAIAPKTCRCVPNKFHVSSGLGTTAGWLGTWENFPLQIDSFSWNSLESFMQFTLSRNSCICEVSCCIVQWLSLNFEQRTRQLAVPELTSILPFHGCHWYECLEVMSLSANSSCNRICSLRDYSFPQCGSSDPNCWEGVSRWSSRENVSLCPRQIPCMKWHASVAAQYWSRTWNDCRLTGHVRKFATNSTLHLEIVLIQAINPLLQLLYLWSELLHRIMISLNFCSETSSTRSSWGLFISPISCIFVIWVSRSAFSFMTYSSCSRTCSLRDSAYPKWASSNSNRWA